MKPDEEPDAALQEEASRSYVKETEVAPTGPVRSQKQKGQSTDKAQEGGARKADMNENRPTERH